MIIGPIPEVAALCLLHHQLGFQMGQILDLQTPETGLARQLQTIEPHTSQPI